MSVLIVNNPFAIVGQTIRHKNMTTVQSGVINTPAIENEAAMNSIGSEPGGQGYGIIRAFAVPSLAMNGGVTREPIMQRLHHAKAAEQ